MLIDLVSRCGNVGLVANAYSRSGVFVFDIQRHPQTKWLFNRGDYEENVVTNYYGKETDKDEDV